MTRGDGDNESISHPDTPRHLSAISSVFFSCLSNTIQGSEGQHSDPGAHVHGCGHVRGGPAPSDPWGGPSMNQALVREVVSLVVVCVRGVGGVTICTLYLTSVVSADQVGGNSRAGFLTPGWVSPSHVVWELVGREDSGGGGVMFISHWVFLEWNRRCTHRSICFPLDASK